MIKVWIDQVYMVQQIRSHVIAAGPAYRVTISAPISNGARVMVTGVQWQ